MRLGMVAPVWVAVPPEGYGGIELVVSLLTEELVQRGHDVTLFASGGSRTKARLVSAFDVPPTDRLWEVEPDATHVGTAFGHAAAAYDEDAGFDLIHDHTDYLGTAFAATLPTPVVHTVHFPLDEPRRSFLGRFADDVYLAAISEYQRTECPELPWVGMVHNAVDVEAFEVREDKDDFVLCIGRICERKGQDLAIEVARRAEVPLVLAGRVHPKEAEFFTERVLPHLDGERVRFVGEVSNETKRDLMARARALLLPIREPEPFGLVMVEAMASGTPVVAEPLGAAPEVITDGETGFLAAGVDAMAEAIGRVAELSSQRCRERAEARFAPGALADGYEALYRDVLGSL